MTMRGIWLFTVLLFATQVQAKVIQGTVTDASTGEPLPAATVQVLGAYDGTISNTEGRYVLSLRSLPAVVEVRYIGYRSQQYNVTEDAADVHYFALEPVPIELETLVVIAEDMGPNIMRKVIAQKQTWWDSLETFRVEAYSRFVYYKGKGDNDSSEIVAIVESLSDGFWDGEKGWREGVRGTAGYRFGRPRKAGVRLSGGVNVAQHKSVEKTTDWHLSGDIDVQRPNPEIDPGNLRSVFLRADIEGENSELVFIFRQRRIILEVEHSRSGFGSDFDFTQFRVLLDWRIKTLFKRRLLPNVLDVRVVGSVFVGTLPRQRFEILDAGLLDGLSTFGAFRTLVNRPYEGEKVLGVFWEHNFRTVPFELIGWRWAAERNIGLIVHGGHGRTWFGDRTLLDYAPQYPNGFHHELGVSINGLFDWFRLDFTKRLDASGFSVSVGFVQF